MACLGLPGAEIANSVPTGDDDGHLDNVSLFFFLQNPFFPMKSLLRINLDSVDTFIHSLKFRQETTCLKGLPARRQGRLKWIFSESFFFFENGAWNIIGNLCELSVHSKNIWKKKERNGQELDLVQSANCVEKDAFLPVKSCSAVRIRVKFSVSNFGGNCFLLNGAHCCRLSKEDSFSAQLSEKVFLL